MIVAFIFTWGPALLAGLATTMILVAIGGMKRS